MLRITAIIVSMFFAISVFIYATAAEEENLPPTKDPATHTAKTDTLPH